MATWLRQSTSVDVPVGPFLDDTDGKKAETALTITQPDIRLKKNDGNWAQKNAAQTLTHEEAGWYEVTLDATDTNTLGILVLAIHEAGALPVWREFMVVPSQVWDSYLSTDALQVHAVEMSSGLITATVIAADAIGASELAADAVTEISTAVRTTAMTESYAADGVAPTLDQAVMMILQLLAERQISGTTLTVKKLDGSTTAMTFTLDSASVPTSQTRAT